MNVIESHMEQVALSSTVIAELPFPPPKIFTNALLHSHDITALIRDTEAHERALFTSAGPEPGLFETKSRKSVFQPNGDGARQNKLGLLDTRSTTAVGRILGGDLLRQLRKRDKDAGRGMPEVDVEALLKGAERLCAVYPIPGATNKIAALRGQHAELAESTNEYEALVSSQAAELARINQARDDDELERPASTKKYRGTMKVVYSAADLKREEEEVRNLEEKRRTLEDRVSGIERDLGGLLR